MKAIFVLTVFIFLFSVSGYILYLFIFASLVIPGWAAVLLCIKPIKRMIMVPELLQQIQIKVMPPHLYILHRLLKQIPLSISLIVLSIIKNCS